MNYNYSVTEFYFSQEMSTKVRKNIYILNGALQKNILFLKKHKISHILYYTHYSGKINIAHSKKSDLNLLNESK